MSRIEASTARAHEAQATTYRWLQGIDSDEGGLFWSRPPEAMHLGVSAKRDEAAIIKRIYINEGFVTEEQLAR
jgi:hypothetical protein